jgi:hypothetical protein
MNRIEKEIDHLLTAKDYRKKAEEFYKKKNKKVKLETHLSMLELMSSETGKAFVRGNSKGKSVKSATMSGLISITLILSLSLAVNISFLLSINKTSGLFLSNQNILLPQQTSIILFIHLLLINNLPRNIKTAFSYRFGVTTKLSHKASLSVSRNTT